MFARLPWWIRFGAGRTNDPRRGLFIVAIALTAAMLCIGLSQTRAFRVFELKTYDFLSTLILPDLPPQSPITVAIDEPSMAEIGLQWPWPRSLHAQLIEELRAAGAAAIGLDIVFAEPSNPAADAALTAQMGADIVLAADETLIETPQSAQIVRVDPLPQLIEAGAAAGVVSVYVDSDGVIRRLTRYPDGFAPGLLRAAGIEPPSVPLGTLMRVYGPARSIETVSYYQALDPENFLPEGMFEGRIVIVGLSTQSAAEISGPGADVHATSYTIRSDRLVAGAEIQATMLSNLASRGFVAPAPPGVSAAVIILAVLLGMLVVWRGTGLWTMIFCLLLPAAMVGASVALIEAGGIYIGPVAPALAFVAVAAGQSARDYTVERRLRKEITRAFSQYLSPAMVEKLAQNPALLKLGGERRTLTILFSDVRGFTTISERLKSEPERLTALINRLLTPLSDIVLASGGTIDKYMGDCIMAFWNAPIEDPDHAAHAVAAGLDMIEAVALINDQLAAEAALNREMPFALSVGVGINTGEVVVGNMGSTQRFDYSALGDAVNLASRLENETKNHDVPILIGPETARLVAGRFQLRSVGAVRVKGKDEIVAVSTVLGRAAEDGLMARA